MDSVLNDREHAAARVPAAVSHGSGASGRASQPARVPAPAVLVVAAAASAPVAAPRPKPAPAMALPALPTPPPAPPPAPPSPPRAETRAPSDKRAPGFAGSLDLGQVVCWQVALMLVLASLRQPWPVVVAASAGAVVLVLSSAVRVHGRWLYELVLLGSQYALRSRRHVLPEAEGKALALLRLLLPGSVTSAVETGHGEIMAVSHPRGMTAILRPQTVTEAVTAAFPSPAALLPGTDGQPGELGIQTVFHVGARPGPPKLWVAVHARRTVATPLDEELTLVLRNALRRVRRALRRAGTPVEPLAQEAALAAVTTLAHVTGGRHEVREDWRFWRTGAVSQACFTLGGLDEFTERETQRLVSLLLGRTPGVAVTVTLNALSGDNGLRLDAVLRLAAATEAAVEAAAGHVARPLSPLGVHLTRLDGTQLSGVAASLPLGGFLR